MDADFKCTMSNVRDSIKIIGSIIEQIAVRLSPEMQKFATDLMSLAESFPTIEKWLEMIQQGMTIVDDIITLLGIESDSAEVLGRKACIAEKTVEDFDSVRDYVEYLKNEVEIDNTKTSSLSYERKIAYGVIGLSIEASALGENLGIVLSANFVRLLVQIRNIGSILVNAGEIVDFIREVKDSGIDSLDDVCEYFEGRGESDRIYTGRVLRKVFETTVSEQTDGLLEKIKMKERLNFD